MSGTYLTWLASELRAAGLTVVEYGGWQTRARSTGGFDGGKPWCVMWHHTASDTSPQNDADYMCQGSGDRPIANLLIARDGTVWVLAAGGTNTNGKGRSRSFSRGTVPSDSMNTHGFGVEIANNGVGQQYPQAQIDAMFKVSNTINRKMGNAPTDAESHQDYAPDRKIDPATTNVQGPWQPGSINSSGTWNVADIRNECNRRAGTTPPKPKPPPIPGDDDDMPAYCIQARSGSTDQMNAIFWWDGKHIGWVPNPPARDVGYFLGMYAMNGDTGKPLNNFTGAEIQGLINVGWVGGPVPKGFTKPSAVDSGVG